jgi:Na+-driven multidrug efflux pump
MYKIIIWLFTLIFGLVWTFNPEYALEFEARNKNQIRKLDPEFRKIIKITMRFFGVILLLVSIYLAYLIIREFL